MQRKLRNTGCRKISLRILPAVSASRMIFRVAREPSQLVGRLSAAQNYLRTMLTRFEARAI